MKSKVIIAIASVMLLSTVAMAAHFNGYDSVDGTEIRFDDYTAYDDARTWAATQWNSLGAINIAPDSIYTYSDLEWHDANRSDVSWDGMYTHYSSIYTDTIQLNSNYVNSYSAYYKRAVATHELGHALGIADHYTSDYPSGNIIMNHCSTCSGVNTPQSHDQSDYNTLW